MAARDVNNIKEHLICSICLDTYKEPKILTCGHSFCRLCLEEYIKESQVSRHQLKCPVDKKLIYTQNTDLSPEDLAKSFPDSDFLEEIRGVVDDYDKDKHRKSKVKCRKHKGKLEDCFCMKCQIIVCNECALDNHNAGECRFETVDRAIPIISEQVEALQKKLTTYLKSVKRVKRNHGQVALHFTKDSLEKVSNLEGQLERLYQTISLDMQEIKTFLGNYIANHTIFQQNSDNLLNKLDRSYKKVMKVLHNEDISLGNQDTLTGYLSVLSTVQDFGEDVQQMEKVLSDRKYWCDRATNLEKCIADMNRSSQKLYN